MPPDPYVSAQWEETRALIRGLEGAVQDGAPVNVPFVQEVLERVGDILRLGAPTPRVLLRWTDDLERSWLQDAIKCVGDEAESWCLPTSEAQALETESFSFTLRRRDEAHSFIVGLTRAALDRNEHLGAYGAYASLEVTLKHFDTALREICSRQTVEQLLGMRLALQGSWTWLDRLRDAELSSADGAGDDLSALPLDARPSPREIEAYISRGALRQYVEAFAARDVEFRQELCEDIIAVLELGESACFVAKSFQKRYGQAQAPVAPVIELNVYGRAASTAKPRELRLAAASEPEARFEPPLASALAYTFEDGSELYVQSYEDGFAVFLYRRSPSTDDAFVGPGVDVWKEGRLLGAVALAGVLELRYAGASWRFRLPGRES